jgi:catalase
MRKWRISGEKRDLIINRQLCHFFRADPRLGVAVANGLGVSLDDVLQSIGEHRHQRETKK